MSEEFFEISGPDDMLRKAKRDYATMNNDTNTDTIFNFFVTAYHVMDYVKAQGKATEEAVKAMYEDTDFQMCQYLCNKGKHLQLKQGDRFETEHSYGAMLGFARLGEFALGEGESYNLIVEGNRVNVTELGLRLLKRWERFFAENGIRD